MSVCFALLLGIPAPPVGPPRPSPSVKAPRVGTSVDQALKRHLEETAGALVVVEATHAPLLPSHTETLQAFKRRLRLLGPGLSLDTRLLPTWMNPNVINGGGQRLHTNYPLGWGY